MKKVLVVDNETGIRERHEGELAGEGYAADFAAGGWKAPEQMKKGWPDLVVPDINMPGIGGIGEFRQEFNTWASGAYAVESHDTTGLKETVRKPLGAT